MSSSKNDQDFHDYFYINQNCATHTKQVTLVIHCLSETCQFVVAILTYLLPAICRE